MSGRLKLEHSIIDGLRKVLERLLADTPEISRIIPGRIVGIRGRTQLRLRVTVGTINGWKVTTSCPGAAQEVFIATTLSRKALTAAIEKARMKR